MGDKNRFSKPVAFNSKNADDQIILKYVARRNFSGYVKKLILEDIKLKATKCRVEEINDNVGHSIKEEIKTPASASQSLSDMKRNASASMPKVFTPRNN